MPAHDQILAFLSEVRSRLNLARFLRAFCGSLLVVGAVLCLWCVWWIWQGYAVPRAGYVTAVLLQPLIAGALWLPGRASPRKAARVADQHFDLKDAIGSHLGFTEEKLQGEFIALQAEDTALRVQTLSPRGIPVILPVRGFILASMLLLACFLMGFKKASPRVLERIAIEEETARKSDEINQELEQEIEDLLKSATDDERELLEPEEWRQWALDLRGTKDRQAALRQYAELERNFADTAQKLNQRDTEQLLSKAAQELQQTTDLKALARSLEEKNYRQAAEQLRQMSLQADVRKADDTWKELAKLKSASQRMASAAREFQQRTRKQAHPNQGSPSPTRQNRTAQPTSIDSPPKHGDQTGQGQRRMDQQMTDLEQAVQNLERQLRQHQQQLDPDRSQGQQSQNQANQALHRLSASLSQSAAQRDLMKKLQMLSQSAGQSQAYLGAKDSQSLNQYRGTSPGGKQAGSGSVESRRAGNDSVADNGNRNLLTGQKGSGPGQISIELAGGGGGKATRTAALHEKVWQRQVERFIQREDVPAAVKDGVKEYFKGIQQVGEEKKNDQ